MSCIESSVVVAADFGVGEARRPCLDGDRDEMDALGDIIELYELDDDPLPPPVPDDDDSDDVEMLLFIVFSSLLLLRSFSMKLNFKI